MPPEKLSPQSPHVRAATTEDLNAIVTVTNRAFLCENGAYSYDIVNLPQTLEDGTYYLLVGGMEEDKPWEPMTSLTEITLHRNN